MSEALSIFLSVFSTGLVLFLFMLIGWVVVMACYLAIRGMLYRRPDCYKTHEYQAHNAVLFNCDGCAYREECWR